MKSSMPDFKHFYLSPVNAFAVNAIIGISRALSPIDLISFVVSNPSITGIWQSIKMIV